MNRGLLTAKKQQQKKGDQGRKTLDEKYLFVGGYGAINAGDEYAAQKEKSNVRPPIGRLNKETPDQTCCQEPIVQALVRSQSFGRFKKFGRELPKNLPASGGPGEHFQPKEVEMKKGYQPYENLSSDFHN